MDLLSLSPFDHSPKSLVITARTTFPIPQSWPICKIDLFSHRSRITNKTFIPIVLAFFCHRLSRLAITVLLHVLKSSTLLSQSQTSPILVDVRRDPVKLYCIA